MKRFKERSTKEKLQKNFSMFLRSFQQIYSQRKLVYYLCQGERLEMSSKLFPYLPDLKRDFPKATIVSHVDVPLD